MGDETKTRLTLFAEALGFDQSARAVDVLTKAQDELAKKSAALEGAKLTGTLAEVEKLRGEHEALGTAISQLTPHQEELNLSTRNFVGLVRQVSPALAFYVEGLFRSVHVAGELGAKNIELNSILKAGKEFITGNANALALMGAGGLVVLGINAISNAVVKMREDFEKATEATKNQQKALNDFLQAQGQHQASLEKISDTRRGGGFTADQSRAARATSDSLKQKWGTALDEGSIDEATGLLVGTGATREDIEDAAFLTQMGALKLDPTLRGANRLRQVQAARRHKQSELSGIKGRERVQAVEDFGTFGAARSQLLAGGGPQLEQVVREALGPGTDDEQVKDAMKSLGAFPTLGELDAFEKAPNRLAVQSDPRTQLNKEQRHTARRLLHYMDQQGRALENRVRENVPQRPEAGATRSEAGDPNIQRLDAAVARMADAAEKIANTPPQTIHNEANSKYIVPGAMAQRWTRVNGESRARDAEE